LYKIKTKQNKTSLYNTSLKSVLFALSLEMDLVLHTVDRAQLFAESFSWWWHWAWYLPVSINFQVVASNSKQTQCFSQLTVCCVDQVGLDCIM